jgi:hypothetical protein
MREEVRSFLVEAAEKAGLGQEASGVVAAGNGRLDKGAREYGEDSWKGKTPEELAAELAEECIDGPTWAGIFAARVREGDEFLFEDAEHLALIAQEVSVKLLEGWSAATHLLTEALEDSRQRKRAQVEKVTPPPEPVTCLDTP